MVTTAASVRSSVRPLHAAVASAVTLLLTTFVAACSSAPMEEETAMAVAEVNGAQTCGSYPVNPACDERFFLRRAWEMANEEGWESALVPAGQAAACIAGLTAAKAIVLGSGGAPPVAVTAGSVAQAIGVIAACQGFARYLSRTGLGANLSCLFQPHIYDADVHLCHCQEECASGMRNSGTRGVGERPKRYTFGYLPRLGSSCFCTDDPKEARCQWSCEDGWASSSPTDCTCR
jgi:hypothetical protein